jgi:maltose O-acetyltransferase
MLRHLLQVFLALLPPTRFFALRALLLRSVGFGLAEDVRVCGDGWFYGRGPVEIGSDTWISPRSHFYTHPDAPIRIGARCDIGHEVSFITGSHRFGDASRRAGPGIANPIQIGEGCWIGARSVILGGVSIGAGTVIAAGAVVTSSLPTNVLAAGVPARVKRTLD